MGSLQFITFGEEVGFQIIMEIYFTYAVSELLVTGKIAP